MTEAADQTLSEATDLNDAIARLEKIEGDPAARIIVKLFGDLLDRGGIGNSFDEIDGDIQVEIVSTLYEIVDDEISKLPVA